MGGNESALTGRGSIPFGYPPDGEDEYLTANSADFHAHLGFSLAGRFRRCGYKFGRWYDMIRMEKLISPHLPDQSPVRPPR